MEARESKPVALVAGAGRGIGAAVAALLVEEGWRVHGVARDAGRVAGMEGRLPGRVHRADVLDEGRLGEVVEGVLALDGRLDLVVNAAGDFVRGSLAEGGWERARALYESNVGTSLCLAAATRAALRASRGSLVVFGVAGLGGHRARRETAAYGAAKSALLVLVRSLAAEEAPHGVRVNMVSPGLVPHAEAEEGTRSGVDAERVPLGASTPEELARAVLWLAGEGAARVTGQNLEVAGGWLL